MNEKSENQSSAGKKATADGYVPRLKKAYFDSVVPAVMKRHSLKNRFEVPSLKKIVVNIGVSDARDDIRAIDTATADLTSITGQKPQVRRAKKAISNFKLRQGLPIGLRVTLRSARMYEFLDRLVSIAIPRIRDFQGLPAKRGFDQNGNYNLGLREQYVFPEIDLDKSVKTRGMNITVVTNSGTIELSREVLGLLGMPFKKESKSN